MSPRKVKVKGRKRIYPEGIDRKERRRLRALNKLEKGGVDVSHAKEDKRSDKELLEDMKNRFYWLNRLTEDCTKGLQPALIVPGAPGIGKTHNVMGTLERLGTKFEKVGGTISSIELYKAAFVNKHKGNVILVDDGDKMFRDEDSLNLLKHMTDSSRRRILNWRTNSDLLITDDGQEVDRTFQYEGSVIFLSNLNFQENVDAQRGKNWEHMEALISRALYLDLRVHNRRAISLWVNYVCTEGKMFEVEGVTPEMGDRLLKWLHTNQSQLREYSLRTVHKLCNLSKGENWEGAAQYTLLR